MFKRLVGREPQETRLQPTKKQSPARSKSPIISRSPIHRRDKSLISHKSPLKKHTKADISTPFVKVVGNALLSNTARDNTSDALLNISQNSKNKSQLTSNRSGKYLIDNAKQLKRLLSNQAKENQAPSSASKNQAAYKPSRFQMRSNEKETKQNYQLFSQLVSEMKSINNISQNAPVEARKERTSRSPLRQIRTESNTENVQPRVFGKKFNDFKFIPNPTILTSNDSASNFKVPQTKILNNENQVRKLLMRPLEIVIGKDPDSSKKPVVKQTGNVKQSMSGEDKVVISSDEENEKEDSMLLGDSLDMAPGL